MKLALMDQPGLVTGETAEIGISNGQICLDGLPVIEKAFGPQWYQITLICEGATYYAHLTNWNTAVRLLENPPRVPLAPDLVIGNEEVPF